MKSIESKTYYELLGVDETSTTEEIKLAYREIARVYHPDSNFYDEIIKDPLSHDEIGVFQKITAAYNVLINEEKRAAYDNSLPKNIDTWGDQPSVGTSSGRLYTPAGPVSDQAFRRPTGEPRLRRMTEHGFGAGPRGTGTFYPSGQHPHPQSEVSRTMSRPEKPIKPAFKLPKHRNSDVFLLMVGAGFLAGTALVIFLLVSVIRKENAPQEIPQDTTAPGVIVR